MFHSASFLYSWAKAQRTYLVCRPAEHRLYSLTPCLSCLAGYDLSIRNTASLPGGLQGKAADKRLSHSISSSYPGPKLGKHSASAQSYITSLPPWLRQKKNSDSLEPASSNSGSLRWRSEERRKGRDNKSFLILSLGRMRNNKAPNSVLSVIQKCCMFHWALEAHKQQHTAHTGKIKWLGKVAGAGEELDSFSSISVFNIARTLFVHVQQHTNGTHATNHCPLHWEK